MRTGRALAGCLFALALAVTSGGAMALASTHTVQLGDRYPPLAKLGPVTTDLQAQA